MTAAASTASELLAIRASLHGRLDERGRVRSLRGVGVTVPDDGPPRIYVGDLLPADLERALDAARPPDLESIAHVLARSGEPVREDRGPVFLIPDHLTFAPPRGIEVLRSADADATRVAPLRPMNWNDDDGWRRLVAGDDGPWVMALDGDRVVSHAHTVTPVTAAGAECGVWTHPDYRGRRLAEATAAAWANLVAGQGRRLFYSTDRDNASSQRVAAHLGLPYIGLTATLAVGEWPEGDAWGRALSDHHAGRYVSRLELETDRGGVGPAMRPDWFFRSFDEWDWWDRELLPRVSHGPVLDLGAGAGRASLWLQDRGLDVTGIDSSPQAVRVCRARGVRDARHGDLNDVPRDRVWGTVLLLCGNLGLGGSWEGNRSLLTRLAEASAPDAILIGDTVEPRVSPEVRLRIRYRGEASPWWSQYNVPVADIPALVGGTGWRVDQHIVDHPDHALLLRKA